MNLFLTCLACAAALALGAAAPGQTYSSGEPDRDGLAAYHSEMASLRATHAASGPATSLAADLRRRVEIDQAVRQAWMKVVRSEGSQSSSAQYIAADIQKIDTENTAYLQAHLPADGWFRNSRDGEQTTTDAWLIVQHSPDHDFMGQVLERMGPLAKMGEVSGRDYALLYDRVEMFNGRPQRFGSQVVCTEGVRSVYRLEDPAVVDKLRAEIGHPETFAQTRMRLRVGESCG